MRCWATIMYTLSIKNGFEAPVSSGATEEIRNEIAPWVPTRKRIISNKVRSFSDDNLGSFAVDCGRPEPS